jgi:energy-coupling factor transporter ATP-binding protein EcfA2
MIFKKLTIRNYMGVPDLELDFESVAYCEITGKNGHGKSSIIEAIRAILTHDHDPARIRTGAEFANIEVEFSDGYKVKMRTKPKKTDWTVEDEKGHEVKRTAEFINRIAAALSSDPLRFMRMDAKEQVKAYQEAMPLTVTAEELAFVPVKALEGADFNKHALEVIGNKDKGIYSILYRERTEFNRTADQAEIYAAKLAETLPPDPPEGNWNEIFQQKSEELAKLQADARIQGASIRSDQKSAVDAATQIYEASKLQLVREQSDKASKLNMDAQVEIDAIRSRLAEKIGALESDTEIALSIEADRKEKALLSAADSASDAMEAARAAYEPKAQALSIEIGEAKSRIQQHADSEAARKLIADQKRIRAEAKSESEKRTSAIAKLEELRLNLIKDSPVPGLEIVDNELYYGCIPFRIVNKAEQIRLSMEINALNKCDCQTVIADDLEHLDSEHREYFKQWAIQSGKQYITARVTDEPMKITRERRTA